MTERRNGRGFGGTVKAGKRGEQTIAFHYDGVLMPRAHPWDVELDVCPPALMATGVFPLADTIRVEVKTDKHEPVNCFMERWTVKADGTQVAGGPWRALADGADAYCYYFPHDGTVLWMWDLETLCGKMDAYRQDSACGWRKLRIGNPDGRCALGRLVPVVELEQLAAPCFARDKI